MSGLPFSTIPLVPRPPGCPIPLTASQLRAWGDALDQGRQRSKLRLCAASLRFLGPLDLGRLRLSIELVIHRHESLRTRIAGSPEKPRQLIDTVASYELPVADLSNVHADRIETFARMAAEEFISEEIDLAAGPLFAARVLRLSGYDHVLVLGIDHLVSDAVSWSILTQEILVAYETHVGRADYAFPRLSVQFPDFAVWQARTQEAWDCCYAPYWKNRLTNAEKVLIPMDNRPSAGCTNRRFLHVPFGTTLSATLADIARQEESLMPLVVLSIHLVIMSQWCQRSMLLIEFFSHGRKGSPVLKDMIGFLAYPIYLLTNVIPAERFKDLVYRVTAEYYSALEHDASRTTGNLVSGCVTELQFNWIQADRVPKGNAPALTRDLRVLRFPITKMLKTSFAPHYYPTPAGVVAQFWYGVGFLDERTLEWLERTLRSITQEVAGNPDVRIGALQSLCVR